MDIFAKFATDEILEVEGRWVDLDKSSKIRVARMNNEKYQVEFRKQYAENKATLEKGDEEADELAKQIFISVMAQTILVGWEGIAYKGKAMKYSVENAKKLLQHKDFRVLVEAEASAFEGYRAKLEEEQGNA